MPLVEDRWLAGRLELPAFTVRAGEPLPEELRPGFYQARVRADRIDLVRELGARGFYVTNTGITLARRPGGPEPGTPVAVRDADPARDHALPDLAGAAFEHDRFHLDPRIPRQAADRIKRDWVVSYLEGARGDQLLVAEQGDEPVGFLAVIRSGPARVIDLMGVRAESRGSGAGAALVHRFLAESEGACEEVRVGTQAANSRATRFYEGLGFRAADSAYDMHLHV